MTSTNKILKQGAEAVIYFKKVDGKKVLAKERIKKNYRLEQIDRKLRLERMRQETKLMREARGHGVMTPRIIAVDEKSHEILMEDLGKKLVKDFLNSKNSEKLCEEIGREIGKMHSAGIIHGDLTTSNMIVKDGKVYFIDFGLGCFSKRIEDMATDLAVLQETLKATHNEISGKCWAGIKAGYASSNEKSGDVLARMKKIQERARYTEKSD